MIETSEDEVRGINTKAQLAEAEAVMQARLRKAALDAGVTLIAPETVHLAADTTFGNDVTIEPFVVIGPGVTIADGAVIHSFSHIVQASIGKKASVGPYARLRPGTSLGDGARIGNFVETKAAILEAGVKVNHLSYIGDAHVGANSNIGAGTITCNYDGFLKHKTIDRRGRLRRHQFLAGGAGEDRQGRLYRLGLGHHQGRAGRCDGRGAQPAEQPRGRREAVPRDEDAGEGEEGRVRLSVERAKLVVPALAPRNHMRDPAHRGLNTSVSFQKRGSSAVIGYALWDTGSLAIDGVTTT